VVPDETASGIIRSTNSLVALGPGSRLGAYEILSPLGSGGMGEVYRARDTKLGRDVAIKVLPEYVAADSERLARFHREAQVLASLNHPNIAHLHGYEESTSVHALVMELVEGETLATRIARGRLGIADALDIAKQIICALDAAHERGIVHRDLKPANIVVAASGTVKVLDFGLAKIIDGTMATADSSHLDTVDIGNRTAEGVVLGTTAYMSPEQARGQTVDKRTDIWAFACVLFEMLAGRAAFARDTVSDTIAAILENGPAWSALPSSTPPRIVRLLKRCLEKDPRKRLRDIADSHADLDEPREEREADVEAPRSTWILAIAVAILVPVAGAAGWLLRPSAKSDLVQPIRATMSAPPGTTFDAGNSAISPDGRYLLFVASSATARGLWLRELSGETARRLSDADGANYPFWSPDNKSIGFFAKGALMRLDIAGGPPRKICDVPNGRGASWSATGMIVYNAVNDGPLLRVSAEGGTPVPLTTVDRTSGEDSHRYPTFLPDGHHFLYFVRSRTEAVRGIYVGSLDDGSQKRLVTKADTAAVYGPVGNSGAGYLFWLRGATLVAQLFDTVTLSTSGEVWPIAESISPFGVTVGQTPVSVSRSGVLVYGTPRSPASQLTWFGRDGKATGTLGAPGQYGDVALAPDGQRVAVTKAAARVYDGGDLWVLDVLRGVPTRVTFKGAGATGVAWSHDGRRLAYLSSGAPPNVAILDLATGDERRIPSTSSQSAPSWTSDDRFILVTDARNDPSTNTRSDLLLVPADGVGPVKPYVQTRFAESKGQFSNDGKWLAYSSDESGEVDVYVQAVAGGGKRRVSNGGADSARWSHDGKELFYVTRDNMLTSILIRLSSGGLEFGSPVPMVQLGGEQNVSSYMYDVTADGRRILALMPVDNAPPSLTVLVNWTGLVRKPGL
jgi:serine/threonine protein kinase/Tol biopolymer transport system component